MSDELQDSLVGYNQVLKEFIGKDADQFESDSSILEEFTELTNDQRLNIAVRATISVIDDPQTELHYFVVLLN